MYTIILCLPHDFNFKFTRLFSIEKTDSRFTLDLLSTCHIWTRDNYPNFVMFFNFMYSLNLFDMYVQTNLYLFYCFDIV